MGLVWKMPSRTVSVSSMGMPLFSSRAMFEAKRYMADWTIRSPTMRQARPTPMHAAPARFGLQVLPNANTTATMPPTM